MMKELSEYTVIPNELVDNTSFNNPLDKLLLICLLRFDGDDHPSMETLSEITGASEDAINDSFTRLVENGVIKSMDVSNLLN